MLITNGHGDILGMTGDLKLDFGDSCTTNTFTKTNLIVYLKCMGIYSLCNDLQNPAVLWGI